MIKVYVALAALSLAFGSGWYVGANVAEHEKQKALVALEASLIEKYNQQKAVSEGISNDYQKQLATLNKRVRALRVRRSCDKVSVATKADGRDAEGREIIHGRYAIDSRVLIDHAEAAETTRLKHNACVDFVNSLY